MPLRGPFALSLWNDLAPEGRGSFHAWHGREHVPQRRTHPDVLCVRRFTATADGPAYFTLYEGRSPEAFAPLVSGAPSELEREVEPHFIPGPRLVCEVVGSVGAARGGLVATVVQAVDEPLDAVQRELWRTEILPMLARELGIASCHLLASLGPEAPHVVLIIESWDDLSGFAVYCSARIEEPPFRGAAATLYRLQAAFSEST
jgi:hypothetical protein